MDGLPENWKTLSREEQDRWLQARNLVLYGGHLITAEFWAENRAEVTRRINDTNVERLRRALNKGR